MILLNQLFYVGQNQNAAFGNPSEFGNNETFPGTGWQHEESRITTFLKVTNRSLDGFQLIGPKCIQTNLARGVLRNTAATQSETACSSSQSINLCQLSWRP